VKCIINATLPIVLIGSLIGPAFASPDERPRGRLIGDGIKLPREIVASKTGIQRAGEILKWMTDRGAQRVRTCVPTRGGCATSFFIKLDNGSYLSLQLHDSGPIYCRFNADLDNSFCYAFKENYYFAHVRDTETKVWFVKYDERSGGAAQPVQTKPPSDDIEM
jgi:hypothetical protein